MRDLLRRFTYERAAGLQEEVDALFHPAARRTGADREHLQRLADWHDRILAGAHYGSPFKTGFNILLPIILPTAIGVIQIVQGWLGRLS
jgi:hypothetical protein